MEGSVIQPNGESSVGGEIYSTTETAIGTWNGATLYRKIVDIGALPSAAGNKTIDNAIPNSAVLHKIMGVIYTTATPSSGYQMSLPFSSPSSVEENMNIGVNENGGVFVQVGKDRSALTAVVIVEYTK